MATKKENSRLEAALQIKDRLVAWRRAIHSHPELGFDVFRTAELITNVLDEAGIRYHANVGKTGVVAYLGAEQGPTIAVRADMDALPIMEENDVPYASTFPGIMHACGHDAHTAMLLGVAYLLQREELPGQVRLLFQPSEERADEENLSGAQRMIEDGAMEGVDAVIAQHVDGTLDTGHIRLQAGFAWAAVDSFNARVVGKGGHGAYPHQTVDPIWLSSIVLNALYAIPSRRVNPLQPNVVTVGVINGGTASNIIPDSVHMRGTLRSYDDGVREQLLEEVERAFTTARALGGDYELDIKRGYPATRNDADVVSWISQVADDLLGLGKIADKQSTMGGEDFAYMTRLAKGAMFRLGVKKPGESPRHLHTATFDIDEDALPLGAAILTETALRYVRGNWE
jgi:amidohydrolase